MPVEKPKLNSSLIHTDVISYDISTTRSAEPCSHLSFTLAWEFKRHRSFSVKTSTLQLTSTVE